MNLKTRFKKRVKLKPRDKRPLEKTIENGFVRKMKTAGYVTRKMNGMGFNDWPDRMIVGDKGRVAWVEFKRPGEEPTENQSDLHTMLRLSGHPVLVSTNAQEATDWVLATLPRVQIRAAGLRKRTVAAAPRGSSYTPTRKRPARRV